MSYPVFAGHIEEKQPMLARLLPWAAGVFRRHSRAHHGHLDFETMPDHMMRDLGFLDGRDPRYEDERWR